MPEWLGMGAKACCLLVVVTACLIAACAQRPQRVFAVQIAAAPPASVTPAAPLIALPVAFHPSHSKHDLNAAPLAELETIPGLSPRLAAAFVAGRPYKAKRELLKRGLLTPDQYDRWKDYLVVHRRTAKVSGEQ